MSVGPEEFIIPGTDISITSLPKVSLHDHLDGGLRAGTIIDLAAQIGLELPSASPRELAAWFEKSADSGSLVDYLATFDITIAVMQTEDALRRIAREFVEDLAEDGVIYGEIRWAPEQHLTRGLTLDQVVEAVQEGLDEGVDSVREAGANIRVGQLITAMRQSDRALEIAELAVRHRDRGVVGFDIAGPEKGFPPSNHRTAFDFLRDKYFPVTVHAGEADGLASIRSALVDGHALRLGHGVRISDDITVERDDDEGMFVSLGPLAQWVKDRQIPLEVSVTSNLQTSAVTKFGSGPEGHPFDILYQLGFCVTVNTDNRLMSRTSLTRELSMLCTTFGYDIDDLATFQLNAAHASFLPYEEREDLAEAITEAYEEA